MYFTWKDNSPTRSGLSRKGSCSVPPQHRVSTPCHSIPFTCTRPGSATLHFIKTSTRLWPDYILQMQRKKKKKKGTSNLPETVPTPWGLPLWRGCVRCAVIWGCVSDVNMWELFAAFCKITEWNEHKTLPKNVDKIKCVFIKSLRSRTWKRNLDDRRQTTFLP